MNTQTSPMVKRALQKIVDSLIKTKKYQSIEGIDIFFCFGSSFKTAMCQYVYGMKINTKLPLTKRSDLVRELQLDIKKVLDKSVNINVCATDIVFQP